MKGKDFEQLLQGVREMRAFQRGDAVDAIVRTAEEVIGREAAALLRTRKALGLSRDAFAEQLGVSGRTLEAWEQGLRTPSGAAAALVKMVDDNPAEILLRMQADSPLTHVKKAMETDASRLRKALERYRTARETIRRTLFPV